MKNCNALYRTLLNITILMFLPTYTMDLTQSTIGFPEEEISQKSTSRPRTQETKKITKELIEYKKQKNKIGKKQREKSKISIDEWKEYQKSLKQYNNIIPTTDPIKKEISKKLEKLTKNIQQKERRLELEGFIAKPKNERTIQDLQKYKKTLETYLANLKEPSTKTEQYQEVIKHIELINEIDEQLKIDYTQFNLNELFDHIEYLDSLRKQLQNFYSERYTKLDQHIQNATSYYRKKDQEKKEQEELEIQKRLKEAEHQERLANLQQELLKQEEPGRMLGEMIKAEELEQQTKYNHNYEQKQARLAEQKRLEQEQAERARKEEEERKQKLAKQERAHQEEQRETQQWIPWITNGFNQARQTVATFVNTIRSTAASWWSWLIRR